MAATATKEDTTETEVNVEERLADVRAMTRKYVLGSMGVGLVPIPVVDFAGLTALQLKMLHSMSKIYGIRFSQDIGKSLIASLVGSAAPVPLGISLASLTKVIPVIGTVLGATSVAIIAGASTYALARVFIQHFESGGNFLNFDPEAVRAFYAEELEKGKAYAENLGKDDKTAKPAGAKA
ncbi:DUF697 domain-containing protein [Hahella aquimaris]|uniref:YcjF family protein n=1 Tax=Hahella sp. HNIBRBA332 TaxID=3015983 RepID=UPI00273AFA76|nr:DUF697 domain-containing protein [Hahella sp. HNIBRBA332]WLQ16677.1 DUF697 domain-containing protein [Hahella sp. HNIBRBA332]